MESRLRKLRLKMRARRMDGLLITSPESCRYISGFSGEASLLITQEEAILLTDFRYLEQAEEEVIGLEVRRADGLEALCKAIKGISIHRLHFEASNLPFSQYVELKEKLKGVRLLPLKGLVEGLRQLKDREEIRAIRKAVKIVDDVFAHTLKILKPGLKEKEVASEIEYLIRRSGAERSFFEPIVLSGPRSSLPHGSPINKRLRSGEIILLDLGARFGGYCSDLTRTVFLDRIGGKERRVYETVLQAQLKAIEKVKEGVELKDIDRAARRVISISGYGRFFGHGIGHGIGISTHEEPRLSKESKGRVKRSMVFTIEPGVYIPRWGGVRIEDVVLVTKDGCEVLSRSPKNLIAV